MRQTERGFTLMELVVTMVVLSIVAGMVAVFIGAPVAGYRDSVARAEMTDLADTVLRRMTRDVRLALPNSIRVSADGRTIEMLATRTGGRYLAQEDGAPATAPALDFLRPSPTASFTLLGDVPTGKQAIVPGSDRVVVFNLGPGFDPADAYAGNNSAVVTAVDSTTKVVSLATNPFGTQNPAMPSPSSRFHVVSGPVRYTCVPVAGGGGTLHRSSGYPVTTNLTAPVSGGVTALAANRIAGCKFDNVVLGTTGASLVVLSLTLQAPGSTDGPLKLTHQVHVDNTP